MTNEVTACVLFNSLARVSNVSNTELRPQKFKFACVLFNSSTRVSNTELKTQKIEFRSRKEQKKIPRNIKRMEVAFSKFIIRRSCLVAIHKLR